MIDSFQKWVDAYTTLMLVLVRAYPGRAVELIKYLQIISRTEAKFKGLTLLNYEEQFRRLAVSPPTSVPELGPVDLELWTQPSRSWVRLNLFASSVTAPIRANLIAPSPTLPAAPREALVLHTPTTSINQVDLPSVRVKSPTRQPLPLLVSPVMRCRPGQSDDAAKIQPASDRGKK